MKVLVINSSLKWKVNQMFPTVGKVVELTKYVIQWP